MGTGLPQVELHMGEYPENLGILAKAKFYF